MIQINNLIKYASALTLVSALSCGGKEYTCQEACEGVAEFCGEFLDFSRSDQREVYFVCVTDCKEQKWEERRHEKIGSESSNYPTINDVLTCMAEQTCPYEGHKSACK
jgi:hypothetical protein